VKTGLWSLVLLICIIVIITNLPSAVSQTNKVTVILYEQYNVKQFNEGQKLELKGQVIYHTPGDVTGISNVYYKIINTDTGKIIKDGYTDNEGMFSFNWSAEYFGKKETNLRAIFPGSGYYDYAESNILALQVFPKPSPPPPKPTYHSTILSLQVTDGSSQGYIKVLPTLTYGSGSKLPADVLIYVDGNYETTVSSNQLTTIFTNTGSHIIKASFLETTSSSGSSIAIASS